MKIQEIFNEYIELLPYMTNHKDVFVTTTLYNSYIKSAFGDKEVSILLLTDYQEFANNLLFKKSHDGFMSRDRIEQIIEIFVSISRFAIKSKYGISENLPLQIELTFNQKKENIYQKDLVSLVEDITFIEDLNTFFNQVSKIKEAFKK